jgi:DNA-binding NarL/FixJ family response regulator
MRVLVLADDLIWSTRLVAQIQAAGADAAPVRTLSALNQALPAADAVIVDLTARAYDGVVAVRKAAEAGRRVLAVGQHDDAELRRRALAAGAEKVHPYRKLFEQGPETLAAWLAASPAAPAARR